MPHRPRGYQIASYGDMARDSRRMDAYRSALRRAVTTESTVFDIGAGTGILSLLACSYGARRVIAIEPDDSIEVARRAARDNGFEDRITFVQDVSTAIDSLPPADVIVSDLRGILPLHQHHVAAIVDARSRFLAPGGALIGATDVIWAALVSDPETYRPYDEPWIHNPFDLDLTSGHWPVVNRWRRVQLGEDALASEPQTWATWNYRTITLEEANVANTLTWQIDHPVTTHGLVVWFDARLDDDASISNRPGEPEPFYGHAFFPWSMPVELDPGDVVEVALAAHLVSNDYVWSWSIESRSVAGGEVRTARVAQNTLQGSSVSPVGLRRRRADHVPTLDLDGRVDGWILSLMDGHTSLHDVAVRTAERFPERFETWTDALARAGELSVRYGA